MFGEKEIVVEAKKEDIAINMVLAITTWMKAW
jgi:hypothetical protein